MVEEQNNEDIIMNSTDIDEYIEGRLVLLLNLEMIRDPARILFDTTNGMETLSILWSSLLNVDVSMNASIVPTTAIAKELKKLDDSLPSILPKNSPNTTLIPTIGTKNIMFIDLFVM